MESKLSYDMRIEILSRTSLNAFHAMRCTNKGFNKLTYDPYLLDMYNKRNNMISGLIIQNNTRNSNEYIKAFVPWSPDSKTLDLSFIPSNARIEASSEQGIMVLETGRGLFHVCEPTTKEFLQLHPKITYNTEMVSIIAVGSNPLHYKILRLSRPENYGSHWQSAYCCEIFDSRALAWSLLDLLCLPNNVFLTGKPVTTSCSIYILMSNNDVLKFNSYLDKWTTFSSPIPSNNVLNGKPKLLKYEGKLGFVCKSLHCFGEIWVLNIDESWTKINVLDKEEDTGNMSSIEDLFDSHMNIMLDDDSLFLNRFKEGSNIKKSVKTSHQPSQIFYFQSDFEGQLSSFHRLILKKLQK